MTYKRQSIAECLAERRKDLYSQEPERYDQGAIGARLNPPRKQSTVSQYEREPERLLDLGPDYARQFFTEYGFAPDEVEELMRALYADVIAELGFAVSGAQENAALITDGSWVNVYFAGTGPAWGDSEVLDTPFIPGLKAGTYVGLKATGDSMAPYLKKGDTAIVLRDEGAVRPGDNCGVWLADDGVVVKRFVRELPNGALLLESLNPPTEAERYFEAPLGSRILGKVGNRLLQD